MLPNSEDRGGMKMPYDFLFTFLSFSKQTAGLGKKSDSTHEYYNLTKFRQNRIKNKKFLFLGHFL